MKLISTLSMDMIGSVAPLVGVWIEIFFVKLDGEVIPSLPSWECGLKFYNENRRVQKTLSLPSWECGLKYYAHYKEVTYETSLPSWECGLKSTF